VSWSRLWWQPPAAAAATAIERRRRVRWEREEARGNNQQMEGSNNATQQTANGGEQREAEALAERRRQANGQHDNQRLSGGRWCGCNKAQRHRLRCGGGQTGITTTNHLRGGGGDCRRWTLNDRWWSAYMGLG
jgi:hypothetical protein